MTSETSSAGSAYRVPASRNVRKRRTAAASTAAAVASRIGALQLVGERGDLLDRGGQIFGSARLLRRRGGGLPRGCARFLGGRGDLPRAGRRFARSPRGSWPRRSRCSRWRRASRRPRRRASATPPETARLFCTSTSRGRRDLLEVALQARRSDRGFRAPCPSRARHCRTPRAQARGCRSRRPQSRGPTRRRARLRPSR